MKSLLAVFLFIAGTASAQSGGGIFHAFRMFEESGNPVWLLVAVGVVIAIILRGLSLGRNEK